MSHTPGPWKLQAGRSFETSSGTFHLSYGLSKTGRPLFSNPCELDSNARLIAAAPEMLEALEDMARILGKAWRGEETWDSESAIVGAMLCAALDAIRKAKGE